MRFSAMTFNVRGSFHDDGANNWDKRRELNLATIQRCMPDVIGFQEAQSGNLDDYDANLTDYDTERGPISIRTTERYHHVPVYWRKSRFARMDGGGFYLSETPHEWSLSWGSTLVRAATWVRLRDITTDKHVIILNSHFPHEQDVDDARTESTHLIVKRLAQIGNGKIPLIVMGDFNARPGSPPYQVFMDAGYIDAVGDSEPVNTFHGFMGENFQGRGMQIDWVLVHPAQSDVQIHLRSIVTDATPPIYPSDHYPVLAEVELS